MLELETVVSSVFQTFQGVAKQILNGERVQLVD